MNSPTLWLTSRIIHTNSTSNQLLNSLSPTLRARVLRRFLSLASAGNLYISISIYFYFLIKIYFFFLGVVGLLLISFPLILPMSSSAALFLIHQSTLRKLLGVMMSSNSSRRLDCLSTFFLLVVILLIIMKMEIGSRLFMLTIQLLRLSPTMMLTMVSPAEVI